MSFTQIMAADLSPGLRAQEAGADLPLAVRVPSGMSYTFLPGTDTVWWVEDEVVRRRGEEVFGEILPRRSRRDDALPPRFWAR